uniref:Putative homing endonuclease n=1 Tax=viral metagenome TaxID=1070528 RepID=A0A6M3JUZ1_9ZZZZ
MSRASNHNYYLKNRERLINQTREYKASHSEEVNAWARKRLYSQGNRCPDCGKPIVNDANYCLKCAAKYKPSGTQSKMWKGIQKAKGYILVHKQEHPRANKFGYVSEHIINWELANNKPLPARWIIHHLNGIKHDNRPCNLAGMPNKKHYLVLTAKAKRIQQLEALLENQSQLL